MSDEPVKFHRDGRVSILGIHVGTTKWIGKDAWRFAPADRPVTYGPSKCRSDFRGLARQTYRRLQERAQ